MRCLVLIALMVSFSGPAWATDSKSTPPPANAKTSVLFMQLRAVGEFDSAKIRLLENVIVGELHKYRKFKVLARQDVENLLDADGFKQAIDCEAQSCLVNVAGALGTDLMVSGELGYMGKKTAVLSLQILHTGDTSVLSQVTETLDGEDSQLIPQVKEAMIQLLSGYDSTYTLNASLQPDSAMNAATSVEPSSGSILKSWWLWTGVGVLAAGVGAYAIVSRSDSSSGNTANALVVYDVKVGQ